jgi:hypothetical protein
MQKIRLTRTVFGPWGEGKKDQVVDCPDGNAAALISFGHAEPYHEPPAPPERAQESK